jgi:hypothetical protein
VYSRALAQAKGASSGIARYGSTMPGARLFRLRMRPGRAMLTATNDGTEAPSASSGDEVIVAEEVAAFLVRQRAAEVIEVIEPGDPDPEAE